MRKTRGTPRGGIRTAEVLGNGDDRRIITVRIAANESALLIGVETFVPANALAAAEAFFLIRVLQRSSLRKTVGRVAECDGGTGLSKVTELCIASEEMGVTGAQIAAIELVFAIWPFITTSRSNSAISACRQHAPRKTVVAVRVQPTD